MVELADFTISQREQIKEFFKEDMRVLEIGCGTGRLTFALAHLVKKWHAIDSDGSAIAEAKRLRDQYKHRFKVTFKVAPGEDTGYKRRFYKPFKRKFDVVFFSFSLHFLENPLRGLEEAYQVLKTGGRVVIIEPEKKGYFMTLFSMVDKESYIKKTTMIADMEKAIKSVSQKEWFTFENLMPMANPIEGNLNKIAEILESNIRSVGGTPKRTTKELKVYLMDVLGFKEHYSLPHQANLWILRKD